MNELELYRRFFEQADSDVFAKFLVFIIRQAGPAADAAKQSLRENGVSLPLPASDDAGFQTEALAQAAELLAGEWSDEKEAAAEQRRRGLEIALACVEWKLNGGPLGFFYDELALAEQAVKDKDDWPAPGLPIIVLLILSGAHRHKRNTTSRKRAEQAREYLAKLLQ